MRKFTCLMTWTAKTREHLASRMIKDLDLLIAPVSHIHEFLFPVRRKAYPPGGAPIVREASIASSNPNVALEISHLVEHLNAVALPVAYIHETVVTNIYTVNHLHERAAHPCVGFSLRPLVAPLAQEFSIAIKHRYAAVTIAIGDINVSIRGIDGDARGHEELRMTRIQSSTLEGRVGGIDNTSFPDLQLKFSVVAVLLYDPVTIAGRPQIVLVVNEAAVGRIRNDLPITETIDHGAIGIELDERWGLLRDLRLLVGHIIPVNDEHVIP